MIGVSHLGETMQYLVQPRRRPLDRRAAPRRTRRALAVGDAASARGRRDVLVFAADDAAAAAGYVDPHRRPSAPARHRTLNPPHPRGTSMAKPHPVRILASAAPPRVIRAS